MRIVNSLRAPLLANQEVWNIAHAGARIFAPENTLPAFVKAKQFDCYMIEIDVHCSKDGILIVQHDADLKRCTDVEKKFPSRKDEYLSDFTFKELRQLDAGSWYINELNLPLINRQEFLQVVTNAEIEEYVTAEERKLYASGVIQLPTLEETLDVAKRLGMKVNIEIKTIPRMYPGITSAIVELVEELDMQNEVLITSFDHEQIKKVRQLNKNIATGILTKDRLAEVESYLRSLDADFYCPGCYADYDSLGFGSVAGILDRTSIQSAREANFGVMVWTCNKSEQMRQLIEAKVTGIITDLPNRLRDILITNTNKVL